MMKECGCNPKKAPKKKPCCPRVVELRYVEIPASAGSDAPGQPLAPENGMYKETVVKYATNQHVYLYTSEGIPVMISDGGAAGAVLSVNGKTGHVTLKTSDLENDSDYQTGSQVTISINNAMATLAVVATTGSYNDLLDKPTIPTAVSQLSNDSGYQTASDVATAVGIETTAREGADANLQSQIDAIASSSDVTDIVGTYAELQAYDTSKLNDNDIIKVLQDETHSGETTYYRWDKDTSTFTLIGEEGPYYTKSAADAKFQDKLTAGANVTIDANNEISATDTTYLAGNGINLTGTTFSADTTVLATQTDLAGKQNTLTAGTNITITGDTISATDTTYSNMTGATASTPGAAGLVPAPSAGDQGKALKGDGTWGDISAQTIFYANSQETGGTRHIYKDAAFTAVASVQDLLDANEEGPVVLRITISPNPDNIFSDAYIQNTYVGNNDYQFLFLDERTYREYAAGSTSDTSFYYTGNTLQTQLTAGTNITITGNTISATDTTYSNFTGTDGLVAGTAGLVPGPTTADTDKYLKSDGTWSDLDYSVFTTNEWNALWA